MDLNAYSKIDGLLSILKDINVNIPRLRGLDLCKDMERYTEEEIKLNTALISSETFKDVITSRWCRSRWYCYGSKMKRNIEKYGTKTMIDEYHIVIPNFNKIHGRHRKVLKFEIKKAVKRFQVHRKTWDKYCGRDDVIRVHARLGGSNWYSYDCQILEKHPAFLEKVDDFWDNTYCNIYFKIRS